MCSGEATSKALKQKLVRILKKILHLLTNENFQEYHMRLLIGMIAVPLFIRINANQTFLA